MGNLFYGATFDAITIPDALLVHVKLVVAAKLRRGECFMLSWRHAAGEPGGRSTIWMQPSIPLKFVFDSAEPEPVDNELLHRFVEAANSNSGLVIELNATADPVAEAVRALQPA